MSGLVLVTKEWPFYRYGQGQVGLYHMFPKTSGYMDDATSKVAEICQIRVTCGTTYTSACWQCTQMRAPCRAKQKAQQDAPNEPHVMKILNMKRLQMFVTNWFVHNDFVSYFYAVLRDDDTTMGPAECNALVRRTVVPQGRYTQLRRTATSMDSKIRTPRW